MKCVQCGMVSCVEESLGGHLKAIHLTTKMCDVSGEVSIFVAFLSVANVNIPLSWTCELIQVDGFLVVINNHNVWLL